MSDTLREGEEDRMIATAICICHKFIRLHDGTCPVHGFVRKQLEDDSGYCPECKGRPHAPWCSKQRRCQHSLPINDVCNECIEQAEFEASIEPAARDGGDEWEYIETTGSAEIRIGQITLRPHWTGLADSNEIRALFQQVITEHHQHQSLVAERERLERMLAAVVNAHYGLAYRSIGSDDGIPEKEAAEIGRWWLDYTALDA